MKKPKIHWNNPATVHHACGMGGDIEQYVLKTDKIEDVTCQRCLGTYSGKKASNRQVGDKPKKKPMWKLSPDLVDAVRESAIATGTTQVALVEAALTEYFEAHPIPQNHEHKP